MSKVPVSVCIIAKNEEKYLEGCLKHLLPYGFEIIVTDTGSEDRTKEIAAKYASKVLDFEWIDDFSAARNFCAQHASNPWILSLDCDEYVNSIDVKGMRILMQKFPRYVGNIDLANLVIDENGEQRVTIENVSRFYNRNFYTFINAVHEQLVPVKDHTIYQYPQFLLPMEVVHHGYNITGEEMVKKQKRNLQLLEKAIEKNPEDSYSWFQIGQSRFVLKQYEEAVDAYEKSLALKPETNRYFVEVAVESLSKAYLNVRKKKESLELLKQYEDIYKSAKFMFALAASYMENEQPLQALLHYIKTSTTKDFETLGENKIDCYNNIIALYYEMGQPEMAEMFIPKYEACKKEKERIINS